MKKLITGVLLAAAFGFASQAHAAHIFVGVDLAGTNIDGAASTIYSFEKDDDVQALSIKWDFAYEAGGDSGVSWGSELGFTITAPDGTSWSLGSEGESCTGCDVNFGFTNDPGLWLSAGSLDITGSYGLGFWEIAVFESFDDAGIDGTFLSGTIQINKVPVPAALWLLGSALMGLGAFRRRLI